MLIPLQDLDSCRDFVDSFTEDPNFSDPHFHYDPNNLWHAPQQRDQKVWGIYREQTLSGLFVFLIVEEERYGEMLIGFSREDAAYQELFAHLSSHYSGYKMDFVYQPRNHLLQAHLQQHAAQFEPVQQTLAYRRETPLPAAPQVELLSDTYREAYLQLHTPDTYWTGEKVLAASDRFRVFLALSQGELVGYLDVTWAYPENEPYDLWVSPSHRGQGYEAQLLSAALAANGSHDFSAVVDRDDTASHALYRSLGFHPVPKLDSRTAHVQLP